VPHVDLLLPEKSTVQQHQQVLSLGLRFLLLLVGIRARGRNRRR
jgi:hypothetical protein